MTNDIPDEIRQNFEDWITNSNPNCPSIERDKSGFYKLMQTTIAWDSWVAYRNRVAATPTEHTPQASGSGHAQTASMSHAAPDDDQDGGGLVADAAGEDQLLIEVLNFIEMVKSLRITTCGQRAVPAERYELEKLATNLYKKLESVKWGTTPRIDDQVDVEALKREVLCEVNNARAWNYKGGCPMPIGAEPGASFAIDHITAHYNLTRKD